MFKVRFFFFALVIYDTSQNWADRGQECELEWIRTAAGLHHPSRFIRLVLSLVDRAPEQEVIQWFCIYQENHTGICMKQNHSSELYFSASTYGTHLTPCK